MRLAQRPVGRLVADRPESPSNVCSRTPTERRPGGCMQAMLGMQKIVVADLESAFRGE